MRRNVFGTLSLLTAIRVHGRIRLCLRADADAVAIAVVRLHCTAAAAAAALLFFAFLFVFFFTFSVRVSPAEDTKVSESPVTKTRCSTETHARRERNNLLLGKLR